MAAMVCCVPSSRSLPVSWRPMFAFTDQGLYTLDRSSGVEALSCIPQLLFNDNVVACGTNSGSLQLWATLPMADQINEQRSYEAFADIQVSEGM